MITTSPTDPSGELYAKPVYARTSKANVVCASWRNVNLFSTTHHILFGWRVQPGIPILTGLVRLSQAYYMTDVILLSLYLHLYRLFCCPLPHLVGTPNHPILLMLIEFLTRITFASVLLVNNASSTSDYDKLLSLVEWNDHYFDIIVIVCQVITILQWPLNCYNGSSQFKARTHTMYGYTRLRQNFLTLLMTRWFLIKLKNKFSLLSLLSKLWSFITNKMATISGSGGFSVGFRLGAFLNTGEVHISGTKLGWPWSGIELWPSV